MKSRKSFSFLFLVVLLTAVAFSCDESLPEAIYGTEPVAAFTATQSQSDIFTWSFTNSSTGAVSYNWDFGDGNGSSEANPSHTYTGAGQFAVILTATAAGTSNAMGWKNTNTQSVQINLPTYDSANVTFTVDMRNETLSSTDVVKLTGTFEGFSGPGSPHVMTDDDNDSIYVITIPLLTNSLYEYKFIVNDWGRQESFDENDACAYQAAGSTFWNRSIELTNLEENVTLDSKCFNTCAETCSTPAEMLLGDWKIHALSVAWEPLKWEGAWWYFVRESDTGGDRPCMDNDRYNFAADGTFKTMHDGDAFIEPWQGKDPEGCDTPVAPYVDGDFTYTLDGDMLTVTGDGAYLGIAKAHNGGEDGVAASRQYKVEEISPTDLILTIDYGAGDNRWNVHLKK
jgi:PKD repeat protein